MQCQHRPEQLEQTLILPPTLPASTNQVESSEDATAFHRNKVLRLINILKRISLKMTDNFEKSLKLRNVEEGFRWYGRSRLNVFPSREPQRQDLALRGRPAPEGQLSPTTSHLSSRHPCGTG